MSFSARYLFAIPFVVLTLTVFLCGPLRISAVSAINGYFNAENAEVRRGPQRSHYLTTFSTSSTGSSSSPI